MVDTNTIISKFYDFHEKPNDITKELEVSPSYITKIIKKWNRSAFDYDKNFSDLVLNKKLKCGADVPKRVSNVINPNFIKSKKVYV